MKLFTLNPAALKKSIKVITGLSVNARKYEGKTITIALKFDQRTPENRATLEKFFGEYDITRVSLYKTGQIFCVNGGEYNSLRGVERLN